MDSSEQAGSAPRPNWFKRHDRLLSAIGTLIVLLTFVVKEQLRDYWKERAQSVLEARRTFELNNHLAKIDDEIDAVQKSVKPESADNGWEASERGLPCSETKALKIFAESAYNAGQGNEGISRMLAIIDPIVAGSEDGTQGVASQLRAAVNSRGDEIGKFHTYLMHTLMSNNCRPSDSLTAESKAFADKLMNETANDGERTLDFGHDLIKRVEQEQKTSEKRSILANYVSIGLYVLGVFLSLAGKLAGGGEPAGAE